MTDHPTVREIIDRDLPKLDANLSRTDEAWMPAAFLLASAFIGPDPHAIAAELEMDEVTAGIYAERARAGGLWDGGKVLTAPWTDDDQGGLAFWMDVSIIQGDMERVGGDKYRMTASGQRRVDAMLGR